VGGVVVSFVAQDGGLALVANDPATGAEVWRRPSTVSLVGSGVDLDIVTDGARVFHMAPAEGQYQAVVEAVDVASGQPAWQTQPRMFRELVEFCDEISGPLCTTKEKSTGDTALWRIAPDTGVVNEMDDINGTSLGGRLYNLTDSPDVARVVGGAVVWQKPQTDLFGGQPVNPDSGWYVREMGDLDVGWFAAENTWQDGEAPVPAHFVAGIASATGDTRWVTEGDPVCGWRLYGLGMKVGDRAPWIRCKVTGNVEVANFNRVSWKYTDVVMEGFDPATGSTTWTADLGAASALDDPSKLLARKGPTTFVVARDDGTLLAVDVGTGATTTPDASLPAWCSSSNEYHYTDYETAFPDDPNRSGHDYLTPCTLTGDPLPAPSKPDDGIGALAGDIFVWMDAGGLHGARVPA
jgi:PQQ-like domain